MRGDDGNHESGHGRDRVAFGGLRRREVDDRIYWQGGRHRGDGDYARSGPLLRRHDIQLG